MNSEPGIWEFFLAGGITMIPLIFCSLLALAITVYKLFELRRSRFIDIDEQRLLGRMITDGEFKQARYHCTRNAGVFTNIVLAALDALQGGATAVREAIEEAGRYEVPKIERYLGTLRTIAAISPLLGLFGTVIGMIRVFNEIRQTGLGNVNQFSGGISEALITTATGLAIAIPTLVMYNFLIDRAERIILEIEKSSAGVMRKLIGGGGRGES